MTESELRLELRGLVEKWEETAQETWALADRCANVRDSVGLWSEANTLNACAADLAAILDKHALALKRRYLALAGKGECKMLQRALELACLQFVGDDDVAVLSFIRKAEAEVQE